MPYGPRLWRVERCRKDQEKEMKKKVIDSRLRAVGGEVVLRDRWYTKGSQGI